MAVTHISITIRGGSVLLWRWWPCAVAVVWARADVEPWWRTRVWLGWAR